VEAILTHFVLFGGGLLALAVGVIYFARSDSNAAMALRIGTSAYAPTIAMVFVLAELMWPDSSRFSQSASKFYIWLQFLPLGLLVFSLAKYPGNRKLHLVLVPLGLIAWAWSFAVGWTLIHGK
jgi:hypothetical protein